MNRSDRKVLSDRNQRNRLVDADNSGLRSNLTPLMPVPSLPRRNLFRKTRSSDRPEPEDKVKSHRSRSRSRVRDEGDWRKRGHENERRPCTRYRPERVRRSSAAESSPSAKSSSPVKSVVTKSWAEMDENDEEQLWQLLTPESLDQSEDKVTAAGKSSSGSREKDSLPVTPRSSSRKITVEELLDTPTTGPDACFKTPMSSSRQSGRSSRRGSRTAATSRSAGEMETQMDVLKRRQKDVDYGKNTIGYQNYADLVPKDKRKKEQPTTPDKFRKMSRRCWDNMVRMWRVKLHSFDPAADGDDQEVELSDILSDMSFDSKITFGDFSSPASSAFPPSSPVSFLTFDDFPPLSSEGNLTDPDYDPAQDKESDLMTDMDESDFL